MKKGLVFAVTLCAVFSVLSSAYVDKKRNKPPATVSPPFEFSTMLPTTTEQTSTTEKSTTTEQTSTIEPSSTTASTTEPASTTTKPVPTTTKPAPTTTKHAPTTTKHAPTTTKPAPTTTKPAPTTTKPAPTTTKPAPTTTKPAPTTTAPLTPTPPANLTVGNYTVKSDSKMCLMALMAVQIRLEESGKTGVFNVQPNITKAEGSCKDPNANLTLTFKEGFITFLFHKNTTRNVVYVSEVSFKLTYPLGGKTSVYTATNKSLEIFSAAVGHSYSCRSESLLMKDGLYLDITHHRMQGFNISKTMDFGPPDACQADRPDYRVAIAVGVVLLVLIIVVVVAYLLSRRRRPDGYQPL